MITARLKRLQDTGYYKNYFQQVDICITYTLTNTYTYNKYKIKNNIIHGLKQRDTQD